MSNIIKYHVDLESSENLVIGAKYEVVGTTEGIDLFKGFKFTLEGFEETSGGSGRLVSKVTKGNVEYTKPNHNRKVGQKINIVGRYYYFKPLSVIHYLVQPYLSQCGVDPLLGTKNPDLVTCKRCLKSMGIPYGQ